MSLASVLNSGFRKEMAKKKRSSWRGGGEIDQGVNSIKFPGGVFQSSYLKEGAFPHDSQVRAEQFRTDRKVAP